MEDVFARGDDEKIADDEEGDRESIEEDREEFARFCHKVIIAYVCYNLRYETSEDFGGGADV